MGPGWNWPSGTITPGEEIEPREAGEARPAAETRTTMVNEYNHLMDEQRYPEAEVVAKRAAELDPKNPVVRADPVDGRELARDVSGKQGSRTSKEKGFDDALTTWTRPPFPSTTTTRTGSPIRRTWKESHGAAFAAGHGASAAPQRAGDGDRKEAEDAGVRRLQGHAAEQGDGAPGAAGGREPAPRSAGPGRRKGSRRTRRSPSRSATK